MGAYCGSSFASRHRPQFALATPRKTAVPRVSLKTNLRLKKLPSRNKPKFASRLITQICSRSELSVKLWKLFWIAGVVIHMQICHPRHTVWIQTKIRFKTHTKLRAKRIIVDSLIFCCAERKGKAKRFEDAAPKVLHRRNNSLEPLSRKFAREANRHQYCYGFFQSWGGKAFRRCNPSPF